MLSLKCEIKRLDPSLYFKGVDAGNFPLKENQIRSNCGTRDFDAI